MKSDVEIGDDLAVACMGATEADSILSAAFAMQEPDVIAWWAALFVRGTVHLYGRVYDDSTVVMATASHVIERALRLRLAKIEIVDYALVYCGVWALGKWDLDTMRALWRITDPELVAKLRAAALQPPPTVQ